MIPTDSQELTQDGFPLESGEEILMEGIENSRKVTQEDESSKEFRNLEEESSRKDDSSILNEVEILTEGFMSHSQRRSKRILSTSTKSPFPLKKMRTMSTVSAEELQLHKTCIEVPILRPW